MNVNELIEHLQQISDKTMEVWVASDPEGNDFHPLEGVHLGWVDVDGAGSNDPDALQVVLWP